MEHSLDDTFCIFIDDSGADGQPAKVGMDNPSAIFTLKFGMLESDGWLLGRRTNEPKAMSRQAVVWIQADSDEKRNEVQPVSADEHEKGYMLRFGGELNSFAMWAEGRDAIVLICGCRPTADPD